MKQIILRGAFCAVISSLVAACGAPKIDIADFKQTEADKKIASNKLPSYVLKNEQAKVIVLPPADSSQYAMCKLPNKAQNYMMASLTKYGNASVVERAEVKKIMQEVNFESNLSGNLDTKGLMKLGQNVDYALVGSITSASTGATYTPESYWTDKDGNSHKVDASCKEEGDVSISYRMIEFPSGKVKKTFTLKGSNSVDSGAGACRVQDPCGRLGAAMETAMNDMDTKKAIATEFPRYGYVWKIMSDEEERAVYISLGKNDGIVAGDELDIVRFDEAFDPVTNQSELIPQVITTCTIAKDNITDDKSICIADGDHADQVQVKYAVRTRAKLNWVEKGLDKLFN